MLHFPACLGSCLGPINHVLRGVSDMTLSASGDDCANGGQLCVLRTLAKRHFLRRLSSLSRSTLRRTRRAIGWQERTRAFENP